jgi:hypothetical protein
MERANEKYSFQNCSKTTPDVDAEARGERSNDGPGDDGLRQGWSYTERTDA